MDEPLDRDLVEALGQPGPARQRAWSFLVTRYSHRLYAVARSFGLDAATSEDLVQTAWLRLIERAHQLRDPDAVGPWLAMIVRNEARRLVTRRRELPSDTVVERTEQYAPSADARLLGAEREVAVRTAFARLGPDCRQLLQLVLADPPLSYDEIAIAVGRPRGSLGPTRRRCLEQLRHHLPAGIES
jgi:RNA polymerase sigma factor (sigma-70 family)